MIRFLAVPRRHARALLSAASAILLAAGLAACANQAGGPVVVKVDLAQAQQMAQQIDAAVAAALVKAQPVMSPAQLATAQQAKAALDGAVAAFVKAPSGTLTVQQAAQAVLALTEGVVNAVPVIPAQYKLLVDTGVAVLDAFISDLPLSVPAPAPAAA